MKARIQRVQPALECLRFYCNMTMLGLTPARLSAPLAEQQFYIPVFTRPGPSDFNLFGPLKESLRTRCFSSDEEVKTAVRKWLKMQPVEFYNEGICALVKRWEKANWKVED